MSADRRLGVFEVPDHISTRLKLAAIVIAGVVAIVLGALGVSGSMPRSPDGDWVRAIEEPAQITLLVGVGLGLVVAWRWTALAAVIIALAGVGLAVLSAIAYPPSIAAAVAAGFVLPSVMLWVVWQHRETLPRIAGLAAVTTTLLVGSWVAADSTYQHFFGPAHPGSDTPAFDDPLIEWAWAGGVGPHGFSIVVKPAVEARRVRALVRPSDSAAAEHVVTADVVDGVSRLRLTDLANDTDYSYRFEVDGQQSDGWVGSVSTSGGDPGREVVIALASCARTGSNGQVFDAIRDIDPDLYVITGDMHYENIARNSVDAFDRAYDQVLTAPAQAALYRSVPVAYVWDDHDYSGNDGDASSPSRPAALESYRRNVPHHELVDSSTINHAFSLDGVRIVIVDTRAAREPGSTMLGADQLRWLREELLASSPTHDLVVVVSPTPWIGAASDSSDTWAGFADERAELSEFIAAHDLDNLMIASGDAHMVAIDDGTNADYSVSQQARVPVLHAAALDRPGNVKGGPYSEGTFPGAGQFGVIRVQRTGATVEVSLEGHRYDGTTFTRLQFEPPQT